MIHSYPWYISDWRSSETRIKLSPAERCLYRELLDYCWMEGDMPTDEKLLSSIAAIETRDFQKSWPKVKGLFFEEGGRLHHRKVDERRPELVRWHEQKRVAGKASVEAKRQRTLNGRSTDATTKPSTSFKPSSSSSSSVPEATAAAGASREDNPLLNGSGVERRIATAIRVIASQWPESCSEPLARTSAEREFGKLSGDEALPVDGWCAKLSASAGRWVKFYLGRRSGGKKSKFIPSIHRWIDDGDYLRQPPGAGDVEPAISCETCKGSGYIFATEFSLDWTEAELEAAKRSCPDCRGIKT